MVKQSDRFFDGHFATLVRYGLVQGSSPAPLRRCGSADRRVSRCASPVCATRVARLTPPFHFDEEGESD
jgi:hypothetical protein